MTERVGRPRPRLLREVELLLDQARTFVAGTPLRTEVDAVTDRLSQPLRVAIAGRTKAGKSTLLNALVGERLAATDATECTRIVTWYRHDLGYSVSARLRTGEVRPLEFDRSGGALEIRLGSLTVDAIDRLEVGWPSNRLADLTLIDTPGLDSATAGVSERTVDALIDADGAGDADVVVYLMRHLHRGDADFLEAFDAPLGVASPIHAVGLLSRADEVGGGHGGALRAATEIARRYAADPRVAGRVLDVVPLSGLLAETGASLREDEVAWLRRVAILPVADRDAVLLSADRFRGRSEHPLDSEARDALLGRFGMFGLRFAIDRIAANPAMSATELARELVEASGIRDLQALLGREFAERADVLRARSALAALRTLIFEARRTGVSGADELFTNLERVEASSRELSELRVLHLVRSGAVTVTTGEAAEIERVLGAGTAVDRIGAADNAVQPASIALAAISRWRTRAASPLASRDEVEVAEGVVRAYEAIYMELIDADRSSIAG